MDASGYNNYQHDNSPPELGYRGTEATYPTSTFDQTYHFGDETYTDNQVGYTASGSLHPNRMESFPANLTPQGWNPAQTGQNMDPNVLPQLQFNQHVVYDHHPGVQYGMDRQPVEPQVQPALPCMLPQQQQPMHPSLAPHHNPVAQQPQAGPSNQGRKRRRGEAGEGPSNQGRKRRRGEAGEGPSNQGRKRRRGQAEGEGETQPVRPYGTQTLPPLYQPPAADVDQGGQPPLSKKAAGKRRATRESVANEPSVNEPSVNEPSANEPSGKKPSGKKRSANGPSKKKKCIDIMEKAQAAKDMGKNADKPTRKTEEAQKLDQEMYDPEKMKEKICKYRDLLKTATIPEVISSERRGADFKSMTIFPNMPNLDRVAFIVLKSFRIEQELIMEKAQVEYNIQFPLVTWSFLQRIIEAAFFGGKETLYRVAASIFELRDYVVFAKSSRAGFEEQPLVGNTLEVMLGWPNGGSRTKDRELDKGPLQAIWMPARQRLVTELQATLWHLKDSTIVDGVYANLDAHVAKLSNATENARGKEIEAEAKAMTAEWDRQNPEANENPQLQQDEAIEGPQLQQDEVIESPQFQQDEVIESSQFQQDEVIEVTKRPTFYADEIALRSMDDATSESHVELCPAGLLLPKEHDYLLNPELYNKKVEELEKKKLEEKKLEEKKLEEKKLEEQKSGGNDPGNNAVPQNSGTQGVPYDPKDWGIDMRREQVKLLCLARLVKFHNKQRYHFMFDDQISKERGARMIPVKKLETLRTV